MATIDFGLIDFSEWINLMAQSELIPDGQDMDSVTGGSIANGYNRLNTLERMEEDDTNIWVECMELSNKQI